MSLEIRNLTVSFAGRRVVDIDSLELGDAEIVALAGESGSGKSMTALSVVGLALYSGAAVAGSIKLDGTELIGMPQSELRAIRGGRISMIFQNPVSSFAPIFRVGTIFSGALQVHGASRAEARDRAAKAMKGVMLAPELLDRYPHQLSGGQAQRVAIALAIALNCEVLLADEPTSALDVTVQGEILELLRRLREQERVAILFISHDLAVVAELCDRVAVMRMGRIVEVGPAAEVLRAPCNPYTRELIASVPKLTSAPAG